MLKSKGKIRGIYLRGDVFWFTKQVNGRRSHVSLETKDYAEAVQRATEVADRPELQPSRAMDAEIQRFIEYKLRSNRYSPASADSKRYILQEFADTLGNISPGQVTAFHCKAFYKRMKERVSPSTAESYMFTLRSFFQWCVSDNLCRRNPAMEIEMDRVDHQARIKFTDLELAQKLIANAPNDDMRFILFCGFHVGMRKQEIIEAIPEWFNLGRKTLEIRATATFRPKDRDARTVPLTDQFTEFLQSYGLRKPFVLKPEVEHGKFRYRYDFRRPFTEYMAEQGVPWVTPHVMRHSFASICAMKGIDIYRIATWLGDDVRVVQKHYAKLRPDDREIMRAFKV
jgi:site-specific recombinase XerD